MTPGRTPALFASSSAIRQNPLRCQHRRDVSHNVLSLGSVQNEPGTLVAVGRTALGYRPRRAIRNSRAASSGQLARDSRTHPPGAQRTQLTGSAQRVPALKDAPIAAAGAVRDARNRGLTAARAAASSPLVAPGIECASRESLSHIHACQYYANYPELASCPQLDPAYPIIAHNTRIECELF